MRTPQFKSNLICPVPPHVQEPPAAQRTDLLFPHAASFPATAGTAARQPCHNFPCIIQVFPISRRINTATSKKDGPRTLAEAVPPMYLSLLLLFLLTLWFPVHRNNMIAVRAPGLCLHWLRGSGADIHDTLSAPWAFQSLHSCPPPRIQPRFLAARDFNLAIVSLSTSCQISINTFPSGKPSSSCASVYLFRPITNTSKPPPMPINLLNLSPSIPAHIYALSQIKSISRSRSNRDTFIWPCY